MKRRIKRCSVSRVSTPIKAHSKLSLALSHSAKPSLELEHNADSNAVRGWGVTATGKATIGLRVGHTYVFTDAIILLNTFSYNMHEMRWWSSYCQAWILTSVQCLTHREASSDGSMIGSVI